MTRSGPGGRPLWCCLGVVAVLLVAAGTVHAAGTASGLEAGTVPGVMLRTVLTAALLLAVVVLARRWLLRRPWSHLGWTSPRQGWKPLLLGAVLWWVPAGVILGLAAVAGWTQVEGGRPLTDLVLVASAVLPVVLVAVLAEELAFRGYLQRGLTAGFGIWPGVLAQAAAFAAWSAVLSGTPGALLGALLVGVLLGVLRNLTGTLWTGIGLVTAMRMTGLVLGWSGVDAATGSPGVVWMLYAVVPFLTVLIAVITRPHVFLRVGASPADLLTDPGAARSPGGLAQRGVLYDVGSSYGPGQSSRRDWHPEAVRRELQVIREELHCTAVVIFGRDPRRLEQAAEMALKCGLWVWLQPRTVDSSPREVREHVAEVARIAEGLRQRSPERVGLSVGCELSVFSSGCIPGRTFQRRATTMQVLPLFPMYNLMLNRLLRRAVAAARQEFHGPLTYGAGSWESVDWRPFDVIGLDYYWDLSTHANYLDHLRTFDRYGKPVIVAEFGCCAYEGAALRGGGGADIMDWSDLADRRVRPGHTRNEQVQSDYVGALIEVFAAEGLHGAFVCMFLEGDCTSSPDPARDLDMASFGVVKPYSPEDGLSADEGHWQPKAAFHAIARRYGAMAGGPVA
jgi:membrane protease YdiL (CAAX protease family)